jgi:hypothetical protein
MRLRTETPLDGSAKRSGINVEVQTGDPEFDRRVYIESAAPDHAVRAALASPLVRRAVLELLASSSGLDFDHDGIHMTAGGSTALEVARVRVALTALDRMAQALPAFAESDRAARPFPLTAVLVNMTILDALLSAGAVVVHQQYPPVHDLTPALLGLGAGAFLWAAAAFLVYVRLRGRSTSLRNIAITCFFLIPLCLSAGLAAVYWINGLTDGSRATTRKVRVVSCEEDSESHTAAITVTWGKGGTAELKRSSCSGAAPGTELKVTTRPGGLGFMWVVEIE